MKGPGSAPSRILDSQQEFVQCCHKLETYQRARFLRSPLDFLKNELFSRSLERRINVLGRTLFEIYRPLLAHLYGSYASSSHTKQNWQIEVQAELFARATALEGRHALFAREFWSAVSSRLELTRTPPQIRHRWKRKFLLLQFLGEVRDGPQKEDLWVLAYGGVGSASNTSLPEREVLRAAHDPFFNALLSHLKKLTQYADFDEPGLEAVRNKDTALLELWLLPE